MDVTDTFHDLGASVGGRSDQFGQQTKDQHLNAHDDQERAERQERTIADVGHAGEPQEGKVGIDSEAHEEKDQADEPKQVQRTALEATEKQRGEEIKSPTQKALNTIFGLAMPAGMVIDGDLADPKALGMGEHRDIAVQFTV